MNFLVVRASWRWALRLYDVGRIEGLLLETAKARAGKCPEGKVWEVLERLTEEALVLWAEREQQALLHKRDRH